MYICMRICAHARLRHHHGHAYDAYERKKYDFFIWSRILPILLNNQMIWSRKNAGFVRSCPHAQLFWIHAFLIDWLIPFMISSFVRLVLVLVLFFFFFLFLFLIFLSFLFLHTSRFDTGLERKLMWRHWIQTPVLDLWRSWRICLVFRMVPLKVSNWSHS